jgi:hypothetical protein
VRRLTHAEDSTTPPKVGSFPSLIAPLRSARTALTRGAERLPHFVPEAE